MNESILNTIIYHIGEVDPLSKGRVTANSHFDFDLAFDSLDVIELIIRLEKEYNIRIPDDNVVNFSIHHNTVYELVNMVELLINKKGHENKSS